MQVDFVPNLNNKMVSKIAFRNNEKLTVEQIDKKDSAVIDEKIPEKATQKAIEVKSNADSKSNSLWKTKGFFSKLNKIWANLSETSKGLVNGTVVGGLVGSAVLGLDWFITGTKSVTKGEKSVSGMVLQPFKALGNMIAKIAKGILKLPNKTFKDLLLSPFKLVANTTKKLVHTKNVSMPGKIISVTAAVMTLVGFLVNARLQANGRVADINHKLYGGDVSLDKKEK